MSASTDDEFENSVDIKEEYLGEQQDPLAETTPITQPTKPAPADKPETPESNKNGAVHEVDPLTVDERATKIPAVKKRPSHSQDDPLSVIGEEESLLEEKKESKPKRSKSQTNSKSKKKRGRPKKNKSSDDTDESQESIPVDTLHIETEVEVTFDPNNVKNEDDTPSKRSTRKRTLLNSGNGYLGDSPGEDSDGDDVDDEYVPDANKKKKRNNSHSTHNENSSSSETAPESLPKINVIKKLSAIPSTSGINSLGQIKITSVSGGLTSFDTLPSPKNPDSLTENETRSCNRLVSNYLKAFLKLSNKMTNDFREVLDKLPEITTKSQFKNMTETIHTIARDVHNEIQITMTGMKRRCRTTLEDDTYSQKTANAKSLLSKVQQGGVSWKKKVIPKASSDNFTGVNILDERVIMNKDITIKKVKNAPAFPYSYMNFNM